MDMKNVYDLNNEQTYSFLKDFNNKNSKLFKFDFISNEEKKLLYDKLTTMLIDDQNDYNITLECLMSVRILSRDNNNLDTFLSEDLLKTLSMLIQSHHHKIAIEALKCFCNCIFNSQKTKNYISFNDMDFLKTFKDRIYKYSEYPIEFKYFDIRLHFLITAFCENTRSLLFEAILYLTEILKLDRNGANDDVELNNQAINIESLQIEVLKLLFNITLVVPVQKFEDDNYKFEKDAKFSTCLTEDLHVYFELTKAIANLLIKIDVENMLFTHAVNLLTNLPSQVNECLIQKLNTYDNGINTSNSITNNEHIINNVNISNSNSTIFEKSQDNDTNHRSSNHNCSEDKSRSEILSNSIYIKNNANEKSSLDKELSTNEILKDENFSVILKLILFLKLKLETMESKNKSEDLAPILKCLTIMCSSHSLIRRFCRNKILPRLRKEVLRLPEDGDALRNRLCKLLTNPSQTLANLSADLLFILCKQSVSRFVKYTGYGNAAGLLAQRGLMAGQQPMRSQYSSSSDSDTEDYKQLKDQVNPVTGRWEVERSDSLAEMTDEQKEFEVNKLINQIHRLSSGGLIQPMKVGEDGKPKAVEHVLELLKTNEDDEDSDSN